VLSAIKSQFGGQQCQISRAMAMACTEAFVATGLHTSPCIQRHLAAF